MTTKHTAASMKRLRAAAARKGRAQGWRVYLHENGKIHGEKGRPFSEDEHEAAERSGTRVEWYRSKAEAMAALKTEGFQFLSYLFAE